MPLGEEKQFLWNVLLKDTSVMTGIRTHTLMTKQQELEIL